MIGDLTNIEYMHVKCPCLGLGFLCQSPCVTPLAPGRGVVGHYIDRCITIEVPTPCACACMPMCFQRNLVNFAKALPAQMIFISTSIILELQLYAPINIMPHYPLYRQGWG